MITSKLDVIWDADDEEIQMYVFVVVQIKQKNIITNIGHHKTRNFVLQN